MTENGIPPPLPSPLTKIKGIIAFGNFQDIKFQMPPMEFPRNAGFEFLVATPITIVFKFVVV